MTDSDLLQRYAGERSEEAFAELVRRHAPMVLAVAQRTRGAAPFQDDIAQAVFLALANKASVLEGTNLAGWLYRAAVYAARHAARTAQRRQRHEWAAARPEVANMPEHPSHEANASPLPKSAMKALDEAMQRLGDADRSALLYRFTRGLAFSDVGKQLGVSEEAARKRVSRALAKLKRGISATASLHAIEGWLGSALVAPVSSQLAQHLTSMGTAPVHTGIHAATLHSGARAVLRQVRWMPFVSTAAWSGGVLATVAFIAGSIALAVAITRSTPTVPGSAPQPTPVKPVHVSSAAGEPLPGGPPISSQTFPYDPNLLGGVNSEYFLDHGRLLARAGGTLHVDAQRHYTGKAYLSLYDMDAASTTMRFLADGYPIYNAAFSADGRRAIYSVMDWNPQGHHMLNVVDLGEGHDGVPSQLEKGGNLAMSLAITKDGKRAAAWPGNTQHVDLWDLEQKAKTGSLEVGTSAGTLAFDPSGQWLIIGSGYDGDASVQIWDVAGRTRMARCTGHTGHITTTAVSPDGSVVATADSDGAIWLWALPGGKPLARLECPWETIDTLVFSPDSKRLLAATNQANDGKPDKAWTKKVRLRLWDVASARPLVIYEIEGESVKAAAFSLDGQELVTRDQPGKVHRWAVPSNLPALPPTTSMAQAPAAATQPTDGEIACFDCKSDRSAAFSRDGKMLICGGMNQCQSWDLATGKPNAGFRNSGFLMEIRPDLDMGIATSYRGEQGFAVLYQLSTGQELRRIAPDGFPYIDALDVSPDGKRLALAGGIMKERVTPRFTPRLQVFNMADGSMAYNVAQGIDSIRCLAFSPDGKRLYAASGWQENGKLRDCTIRVLDAKTGIQQALFPGRAGIPKAMAVTRDGRQLWIVGTWGAVDCLDTATGHSMAHIDSLGQAYSIAVSPDGQTVAVGLADHNIILIDAATGVATRRLRRHRGIVMALAFSSDSTRLASVSTDKTARVWNVRQTAGKP